MIVVKAGGGKKINWDYIAEDLKYLTDKEEQIVLIHGASQTRDEIAVKLGAPVKTIVSPSGISSVYSDEKSLDIFLMAYAGLVNKRLVEILSKHGINAVGLTGVDGQLWTGKKKKAIYSKEGNKTKLIMDNMTGRVNQVNSDLIRLLLKNNYLPVICPPAISTENEIINTDGDWATAVTAGALQAETIVVLFEAPGLLKKFGDESSLIKTIDKNELDKYLGFAQGRMKKKLLGAKEAFRLGVKKIYWSDGRIKNPVINALNGKGTIIS